MDKKKKRNKWIRIIILVVVIALIIFFALINFITDFLWFRELGYVSVFFTKLFTQLKIGVPVFLVITLATYIYFKLLKKSYFEKVVSRDADHGKAINYSSWGLAALFGVIVTYLAVTRLWYHSLEFVNKSDFNLKDGLFHHDAGFYVFQLDFITRLVNMIIGLMVILLVITIVYYFVLMSLHKPQVFHTVHEESADQIGRASCRERV